MNQISMRSWCVLAALAAVLLSGFTPNVRAASQTFVNTDQIIIPAVGSGSVTGSPAAPYPSVINVDGLSGQVIGVTLLLRGFSHGSPQDVDLMLAKSTTTLVVLSDAGSSNPVSGASLTFSASAPNTVPTPIVTGTYLPSNIGTGDLFPGAPKLSNATNFDVFYGANPNGAWNLYVVDDATNNNGFIGGWQLTIDTTQVPVVFRQPVSQIVPCYGSAFFRVGAAGEPPLSYQWRVNCRDIPDGTNATLIIPHASLQDAGNYSVTVSNAFGKVTSWDAALSISNTVSPAFSINRSNILSIVWPVSCLNFELQESALLDVRTPWSSSLAHIRTDGTNFTTDIPLGSNTVFYRLVGSTVNILTPPQGRTAAIGDSILLSVVATGVPPLEYQWRRNGILLPFETNSTLKVDVRDNTAFGAYQVMVGDVNGALNSMPAVIRTDGPETILADNFADRTVFFGFSNSLHGTTFGATREPNEPNHGGLVGGKSVWLDWQAPTTGIVTFDTIGSGFDTILAVYTFDSTGRLVPVVSDDDSAGNRCSRVRFNALGQTTYTIALDGLAGASGYFGLNWSLEQTSQQVPIILVQPHDQVVQPGIATGATFDVVLQTNVEFSNFSYLWLHNGQPISGATKPSFTVGNPGANDLGDYSVVVNNGVRSITSQTASLQLATDPQLHFVSKLLADPICGTDPISNPDCCGAGKLLSLPPNIPKILTAASGSIACGLTTDGTTPSSTCKSRSYWTWITNSWACARTVNITGVVKSASTSMGATLAVYDEGNFFAKKCSYGTSPVHFSFSAAAGANYWICLGFDSLSATGTVSYGMSSPCP